MTEKTAKKRERRRTVRELKTNWAVHHMLWVSDITDDICKTIGVEKQTLYNWIESLEWEEALDFWGVEGKARFKRPVENERERHHICREIASLKYAESFWQEMIENGEDMFPPENMPIGIRNEEKVSEGFTQIGLEALPTEKPLDDRHPRLRIWIHDIITLLRSFAIW